MEDWPLGVGGGEASDLLAPSSPKVDRLRTPAYEALTARLRLLPASPEHAEAFKRAADASAAELRPWMPWAEGLPMSVEVHLATLREFRARFERDEDHVYLCFDRQDGSLLGGGGLHRRIGPNAVEIGYWIRTDRTRQGIGTEFAAALTHLGLLQPEVRRAEIRVAVGNAASSAIPRKLGYSLDAVLRERIPLSGNRLADALADAEVWSLLRREFPRSAAAEMALEARDALGRRMEAPGRET